MGLTRTGWFVQPGCCCDWLTTMKVPEPLMRSFAKQLGNPSGIGGRVIGRVLNRANRGPITGSVAALDELSGATVADIGFGGGLGLQLLLEQVGPTGHVYGIDPSATAISDARKRFQTDLDSGRLQLECSAMDSIPLPDASLDAAITANTLYYIEDIDAALRDLARVLRPGGRAVIGIGDPKFMATLPFTQTLRLRPLDEVAETMSNAGLKVVDRKRVGNSEKAFHLLIATRLGA